MPLHGKKVLDVGCGGGILADAMARKGADVLGIDLATKALRLAQLARAGSANAQRRGLPRSQRRSAWRLSNRHSFDVVTCMEMLEHVPDPASVVRACATLVKPGGWVFFLDPQPQRQVLPVCHRLGAEYVLNMLPRGTHELRQD